MFVFFPSRKRTILYPLNKATIQEFYLNMNPALTEERFPNPPPGPKSSKETTEGRTMSAESQFMLILSNV